MNCKFQILDAGKMCKHILNAQASILAPCCKQWFDCSECHKERADHEIKRGTEMIFGCKKCKAVFRKDLADYDEADEYCPRCDNRYVIPAVTPPKKVLSVEVDTSSAILDRKAPH